VAGTARGFKGGCACPYGTTFSVKAQKCMGGKPPAPGPTPGGPYCVHDAPTNACGTCTTPEDCGGNKTDWSLCWANMDEKCTNSDAALVLSVVEKAPLLGAKKPLCNPKFACCTRGADFCRAKDEHAFCDPTVAGTARGFKGGCACPYGTTFSVKAQKCMGGKPPAPGPTPGGPYCVHDAPTNACGTCTTPEDCGGNKTDWSLCWANMDEKCTNSDVALVQQSDAETCMESGNLGCLQPSGACNYEKCTPCCAGLICYHDQDAGDMCMRPPPVADVEQSPQGCPAGTPAVSDANPFPCHASGCSQPYTCNEETGCCSETVLFA